jgi:hypothetical protein
MAKTTELAGGGAPSLLFSSKPGAGQPDDDQPYLKRPKDFGHVTLDH